MPLDSTQNTSDKVYQNQGNAPLLALIDSHFSNKNGRLLDIGCGAGDNARILSAAGWHITGITLSQHEHSIASRFCEQVYVQDLENGIPLELQSDKFDLVLMSHVLEHLRNPNNLLVQVRGMLTSEGRIAVALPNVAHYSQRLKLLRGEWSYTQHGLMDNTHLKFYTHSTSRDLLTQAGFRILKDQAVGGLPWYLSRKVIPASARKYADSAACGRWPNMFGHEMQFIAAAPAIEAAKFEPGAS